MQVKLYKLPKYLDFQQDTDQDQLKAKSPFGEYIIKEDFNRHCYVVYFYSHANPIGEDVEGYDEVGKAVAGAHAHNRAMADKLLAPASDKEVWEAAENIDCGWKTRATTALELSQETWMAIVNNPENVVMIKSLGKDDK